MNTLRLSFCLLLLLAQAALAPLVQAQSEDCPAGETCQPSDNEVIGVSIILTPLELPITTYSATILGSAVAANYDPAVGTQLSGDGLLLGRSFGYYGGYDMVEASISTSQACSDYSLWTTHSVGPYLDDGSDDEWYLDPMDFTDVTPDTEQGYIGVYGDASGEWIYPETQESEIDVGYTYDDAERIPPTISSVTQQVCDSTCSTSDRTGVNLNSTGTLIIMGASLEDDGSDPYPSVCVNGICFGNGTVIPHPTF